MLNVVRLHKHRKCWKRVLLEMLGSVEAIDKGKEIHGEIADMALCG